MILIKERFISADHIEHIYVEQLPTPERYAVIVQLSGDVAVFGRRDDILTLQMAFELRRRIVKAIVKYKSSDSPELQHVDFPKYEEVHPE
ncbi:MAG: hypothetical protein OXU36_01540 [Candidatus Poribacteria bacterium]|nr:hypothetical protein [Candidatus Poribacteria bacterium]